jgi:hypothetical protein
MEQFLTDEMIERKAKKLFEDWLKPLLEQKALPMLLVAAVVGDQSPLPFGCFFTINGQGRTPIEVLKLLKDLTRQLEGQLQ